MFKRLFEEKPCTEQETRLLQALAGPGDGYDTYISLMEEFAAPYDFRSAAIRRAVTAMASKAREARIRKAEQTVKSATDSIEQYRREIYRLLSVRTDAQERLMGMRLSQEQDAVGKELSDFFLANRRLLMTDQDGSSLTYWVKTYLSYWDDRSAPTYLASHSSYLYSGAESAGLDHGKWERKKRNGAQSAPATQRSLRATAFRPSQAAQAMIPPMMVKTNISAINHSFPDPKRQVQCSNLRLLVWKFMAVAM